MLLLFNVLRERHTGTERVRDFKGGEQEDEREELRLGERGFSEHSQNLQRTQSSERPLLDTADVVLIQLTGNKISTETQSEAGLSEVNSSFDWICKVHGLCSHSSEVITTVLFSFTSYTTAPVCVRVFLFTFTFTHRFLRSVAPLKALLGMAWMAFSLRSLENQKTESGWGLGMLLGVSNTNRQFVLTHSKPHECFGITCSSPTSLSYPIFETCEERTTDHIQKAKCWERHIYRLTGSSSPSVRARWLTGNKKYLHRTGNKHENRANKKKLKLYMNLMCWRIILNPIIPAG